MRQLITLLMFIIAGCSSSDAPLVATDVKINAPLPGMNMSAGYLTLHNNTSAAITITHVSSPQFGSVEMHETIIRAGISRMVDRGEVTIPADESVSFEPGGRHLMLMRPTGELASVSLEFYSNSNLVLAVDATVSR